MWSVILCLLVAHGVCSSGGPPLKRRKRELTQYDDSILPRYRANESVRMNALFDDQHVADLGNDGFTPDWGLTYIEVVPGYGPITLSGEVARGPFSRIFGVKEHPDLVIKYQTDCVAAKAEVPDLVKDFHFGKIGHDAGVSPIMYFLSPPALLPVNTTEKTDFRFTGLSREYCVSVGASVRYLVMERVIKCLSGRNRQGIPVAAAASLGIVLLRIVETLHSHGVVHGDIHTGNICVTASHELRVIDYGKASFVTDEADTQTIGNLTYPHPALTHWQLQGYQWARRDDVYKAIFAVAEVMHGGDFWALIRDETDNIGDRLLQFKRDSFFFNIGGVNVVESKVVRSRLERVLSLVRSLDSVTSLIPYDLLKAELKAISSIS